MKTIAFYSYKGGTGKSITAANLAVCLSRLNINCVLMDMDFEGPSSHNKFSPKGTAALGTGGFMKYVSSHIKLFDDINFLSNLTINNFSYLLSTKLPNNKRLKTKNDFGAIHLISAGDIYQEDYFPTILSPRWQELFGIYNPEIKHRISETDYNEYKNFFQETKKQVSMLTPKPDYLILDLRPGVSTISNTIILEWVDTLVSMFSCNEESINYLAGFFNNISIKSNRSFDVIPVLCRVPVGFEYKGNPNLKIMMDQIGQRWDDIITLHSDRNMELNENIQLGFYHSPQNTRLSHDYVKLFSRIICTYSCNQIEKTIGLSQNLFEQDRIFKIERERGHLINPSDNSRNVSFKVETFQLLLKGFEEGLSDIAYDTTERKNERIKKSIFENCLFKAGVTCGEKFGKYLKETFATNNSIHYNSDEAKIKEWCIFDSDVGFGKFELDPSSVCINKGTFHEGNIILRESFLTPAEDISKTFKDHRCCNFMKGYIQGIMNILFGGRIQVEHRVFSVEEYKNYYSNDAEIRSESCLFTIKRTL